MKVRKRLVKEVAKRYAASLLMNAMGSGASSQYLNEDENELLVSTIQRMSENIHPTTCGTLDDCVYFSIDYLQVKLKTS